MNLTSREAAALRTAVGFMTAGEADGVPGETVSAAESAMDKLASVPAQNLWVPLSRLEIRLLWAALRNGAEGLLQPSAGYRSDERQAFRNAANRLADAAGLMSPRF